MKCTYKGKRKRVMLWRDVPVGVWFRPTGRSAKSWSLLSNRRMIKISPDLWTDEWDGEHLLTGQWPNTGFEEDTVLILREYV